MINEDWHPYDKFDPHDTIALYYDADINRFIEGEMGMVVYDIYRLLHPSQIYYFKIVKEDCVFPNRTNEFLVELIYPELYYKNIRQIYRRRNRYGCK